MPPEIEVNVGVSAEKGGGGGVQIYRVVWINQNNQKQTKSHYWINRGSKEFQTLAPNCNICREFTSTTADWIITSKSFGHVSL